LAIIAEYFRVRMEYVRAQNEDDSNYDPKENDRVMKFPLDELIHAMAGL
jgi:hypothetical protein